MSISRAFTRMSLFWQLLIPSVLAIVISVSAVEAWTLNISQDKLEHRMSRALDGSLLLLKAYLAPLGAEWSSQGGQLRLGTNAIDGLEAVVDNAASASGGVVTIFNGDERVATNVHKADGSRAVGTKLTDSLVRATVLEQGQTFRGTASILGHQYLTIYEPIRDRAGHVLGILFTGLPTTELDNDVSSVVTQGLLAGLIVVGLITLCQIWLSKRTLMPLNALATATSRIASGDLMANVPGLSRHDEVGSMATALNAFKEAGLEKLRNEASAAGDREASERQRREHADQIAEHDSVQRAVVGSLEHGLERLASGDLSFTLDTAFKSEYEPVRTNFNAAVAQLHELVTNIVATTADVDQGSREITQASDDLSRRTEQTAASLQQTAAAVKEMSNSVSQSARSADLARDAVVRTSEATELSGQVAKRTVTAMGEIKTSSEQVGHISGVIKEIALQTNLLALNAGVEAARAGDAGRGFAIVAAEVRSLAQRSTEAAKEIDQLIAASTKQVEAGVALVGETGEALSHIAADMAEISGLVVEIAFSANEQATGLAEVNTAVGEMDKVTQRNVALVEQSAASSHALADKAASLASLASRFQLSRASQRATAGGSPVRYGTGNRRS